MKKLLLSTLCKGFLLFALVYSGKSQAQLFYDGINYTVGQNLAMQSGWNTLNTGDALAISSGSLSSTSLPASVGNKVTFDGAGIDAEHTFTQQTSGTVYYSFLLNVTALGSLSSTGGYFTGFAEGAATNYGATVWLRSDGAGYDIGINRRTTAGETVWTTGTTALNTTILVVVSYQIVSGTLNDNAKLWINPTTGGTEPGATRTHTGGTGPDLANLSKILIRQDGANATPFVQMDEIRVGTTWASVTPSGAVPEIDIRGNGNSITSGDSSPSATDFTDLGSVSVSSGTATSTFFVHNTGTASLTVGAISFSGAAAGDYSVSSSPTSPLNGGGFTSFDVTFDPSDTGARNAIISIVNNDGNENPYTFSLTGIGLADVAEPDFVNLQSPATQTVAEGNTFTVKAQVYEPGLTEDAGQGADVQGWIGYSSSDTSPDSPGWAWVPASYFADAGPNDEYSLLFGAGIAPGTYYYASRFQIGTGPYVYGGTFGIWALDSGVLTVTSNLVDFCNIAPATGAIAQGSSLTVLAQVFESGVTEAAGQGAGISGWIGYSASNTNPNSGGWTWVAATFNSQSGNNDVYSAAIGASLLPGTYYYASRFQKTGSTEYSYGGTGGFWNNDNGVLTVNTPQEINIQGNSVNIASGDSTPSAGDHTDFGAVVLGNPVVRTFTIQNTGGSNLVLNNPAVTLNETDGFTITQQPTSPVTPGGSTTFQITFNPAATGNDMNTIVVGSNDGNESVYSFSVQGAATIAAPIAIDADPVGTTSFTAKWNAVAGATGYRLDVSSDPAFEGPHTSVVAWNFPSNPDDAIADGGIAANLSRTITTGGGVTTPTFTAAGATTRSANATNWLNGNLTKYWEIQFTTAGHYSNRVSSKQRGSNTAPRDFKLQYKIGSGGTYTDVPGGAIAIAAPDEYTSGVLNNLALPAACDNQALVYLRWIMTSNTAVNGTTVPTGGSANIDDILVEGRPGTMISPYDNFSVGNVTSYNVNTNITANTTYYYRVRAVSGGTSGNSNPITVTTDPVSVTWASGAWSNVIGPDADIEVSIEDAYNSGESEGEFVAKKLTINTGGSLTIATGTNITVVNEVVNHLTEAALVIENDANLIQVNDVDNTGNATIARDSNALMRLDYTLWSSPVAAQNLLDFSPDTVANRFYLYNPGTNLYNVIAPSNDFTEATGYLIRMPNDHPTTPTVWNGTFVGEPNNGNVSITVANNTFNAVGNPYPSTIDADLFIGVNNLAEPLYFWRKTNNAETTSYATYTLAGGTGTEPNDEGDPNDTVPNGIIQVGQGFIAKSTSTALVFNNQMRVADNNGQFFRTNEIERNRIWLNLTASTGIFSQTMVSYMTGATQGVDAAIDGLYFNDSQIALTSMINNTEYAVQGRALPFADTDVVALGFKVTAAGNYTIGLDHMDGLFENESLHILLKDNSNNSTHNLKQGNYTFASEAGIFNSRFEIVYQTTLATSNPIWDENQVVVYKQGDDIIINSGKEAMSKVKVFDICGRLLVEKEHINALETRIFAGTANEVLVVKIISNDNREATKKVVN